MKNERTKNERTIWLYRLCREKSYRLRYNRETETVRKNKKNLLEKGYLTIGYYPASSVAPDICDDGVEFDKLLTRAIKNNLLEEEKPRYLRNFCREMKKGDWVIVRSYPKNGEISIFELAEKAAQPISKIDSAISENLQGNIGFFRRVIPVAVGVPRKSLGTEFGKKVAFNGINDKLNYL